MEITCAEYQHLFAQKKSTEYHGSASQVTAYLTFHAHFWIYPVIFKNHPKLGDNTVWDKTVKTDKIVWELSLGSGDSEMEDVQASNFENLVFPQ